MSKGLKGVIGLGVFVSFFLIPALAKDALAQAGWIAWPLLAVYLAGCVMIARKLDAWTRSG